MLSCFCFPFAGFASHSNRSLSLDWAFFSDSVKNFDHSTAFLALIENLARLLTNCPRLTQFGGSINVVPWVYGPEILPLQARSRGTAISVAAHWTWNFFVVMITPVLINRLGWKTYLIFMSLAFSFVPIIYFFYPETSNISLEDIDRIFLKDGETSADASERSSTIADNESADDMRVRHEQTDKVGEKHVEDV